MIDIEKIKELDPYIRGYCDIVKEGVEKRSPYLSKTKEDLVVGALMARIATLSAYSMACPVGWNHYVATFSFRAQVECFITLIWMLKDVNENSKQYITDSIKKNKQSAKKYNEFLSNLLKKDPELENLHVVANHREEIKESDNEKGKWWQSQQAEWRGDKGMPRIFERAETLEPLLKIAYIGMYSWLCEHSHNSWYSLYYCNTKEIPNSTQRAPAINDRVDIDIMKKSAQYLSVAYQRIDRHYDLKIDVILPIRYWERKEREIREILDI